MIVIGQIVAFRNSDPNPSSILMQERLLPLHCQHFHVPSWHWLNQSKEFGAISERKCYFQECMATNTDNFIILFLSKTEYVVCFIFS